MGDNRSGGGIMATEKQVIFDEVCRVIGRAVIMLKENNQSITRHSINLRLRTHAEQNRDTHISTVYVIALDLMKNGICDFDCKTKE